MTGYVICTQGFNDIFCSYRLTVWAVLLVLLQNPGCELGRVVIEFLAVSYINLFFL